MFKNYQNINWWDLARFLVPINRRYTQTFNFQAWSYCWWQPEIRCEKTSCSHYLWRILYIQPTINSMGGVRAPMVSTGKIFGRRTFGGCRSLLGAACRQSWMDKSPGDLVSFWTRGVGEGRDWLFPWFSQPARWGPKKPDINGVDLSSEVRLLHPSESDLAFGHLEGMFHPIETNW